MTFRVWPIDFRVRRIAPLTRTDPWVYATIGAWQAGESWGEELEFLLLSPSESPRHVATLAMVANFHADAEHRLSVESVIEIGRPWMEGSVADHLLVALPYEHGPKLEHVRLDSGEVRYLWLVPISPGEADFAKRTPGRCSRASAGGSAC